MMDFFTVEFLWGLLAIVFIDLVLAGDNAIVIGMAASNLPVNQRRKAIVWGTTGAILLRAITTFFIVWLLRIPALMLIGGLLLIWIAYKLLTDKPEHDSIEASVKLRDAVRKIIIADGVMGIDNVLGIAGVAHGNMLLVTIGMLITIPIIVWGSTAFIQLLNRFPMIVYVGGAILAWTAGSMIVDDPIAASYFTIIELKWLAHVVIILGVLIAAWAKNRKLIAGNISVR